MTFMVLYSKRLYLTFYVLLFAVLVWSFTSLQNLKHSQYRKSAVFHIWFSKISESEKQNQTRPPRNLYQLQTETVKIMDLKSQIFIKKETTLNLTQTKIFWISKNIYFFKKLLDWAFKFSRGII